MTRLLLTGLLAGLLSPLATAAPVQADHVEAELVAERTAFVPGGDNWVALKLRPDPEWHVYWRNPGDSGIATSLKWTLPDGVDAGEIHWPLPHQHRLGDLSNYGYGEQTLHLVPITVDGDVGSSVTLRAKARWLVCRDVCIPGEADLALTLPVRERAGSDPDWAPDFNRARAQLPRDGRAWPAQFQVENDTVSLTVTSPAAIAAEVVEFFPYANDLVNHAAPQRQLRDGDALRWSQQASPYFVEAPKTVDGVLVLTSGRTSQAWEIAAQPGSVAIVAPSAPSVQAPGAAHTPPEAPASQAPELALVLGFALLGGLILNLMPCVFPVLSLKALAIAQSGREQPRMRQQQALAYTAGVVLSCVAIAAAMLALRGAGASVGWGFQLQSPVFIALLAYLLFALGLSLSGAAQFGLGLMNLGGQLAQKPGLGGAFFTGVLAVVVATPCTAPFMGTALGYAMTQSAAVALSVFAVLGLGLALPFLLLGFVPQFARWLPKPGAWMERFKQFMAFPLYVTVVWLLWVLVRQTDPQWLARALLGLVLIAFALWLWSLRGPLAATLKLAALAAALALIATGPSVPASAGVAVAVPGAEAWSAQRVAELRAEGRTVFVDFTADWCLTCKVNERVALKSPRVEAAFRANDVTLLIADWTRSDPAITAELARYGRNGVPLYLVYRKGGEPIVLPQLLTPDLVIDSIQ
jgi:thiol:disulfide interchange protein